MAETLTDIMKGFISEEQAMREEAPDQPTTASLVKAGAIELGDYEKGFFENQADAVKGALAQARTIAPSIWQHIGQSAQEYKRKYDFLSKKTLKGGEWDPDGKNVISDTMMIIGGMLEFTDMWPTELQEEYAEYMAENPWDMEIKDSVTNKIFNTPVESIRKEIKDHYWLHPDERPDQADSFMDGLLNPSKGVASVIQSLPMAVGSMSALYFKQPTLAAAIIFGAEGSDAYEDSLAYLMDNDVAEGKMSEAEAKNEARKMYVAYGAAATAIEMWQMDKWLKLGKNLGTAAHNLLAGEFIRKGLKHKNKSFTGDWIKNAIFQTLEENTQGTLQEAIAHNNFDRPIEGGIRGFMQRRGAEAITMLYMGAPGLPGSVSFDIMNGPVQRSDGYVKRDVAALAEAREHARKAGRKFMNPEDYMVPTILSRRH
ncbi:MAG: hypothetical protein ACXADL_16965, partial [Candidatus Thorarchaeota archaeon]